MLHRRGLQSAEAPFRARIPEPRKVRGQTRPTDSQTRSLKLPAPRGALQKGGNFC
jgi:hypothetical protein